MSPAKRGLRWLILFYALCYGLIGVCAERVVTDIIS
jgi:hypothetical protein